MSDQAPHHCSCGFITYRYKYPRQTPFSFSRAFLCAVWDMSSLFHLLGFSGRSGNCTLSFNEINNIIETCLTMIFFLYLTQCFTISSILEQYSFLTGNQCPQWHYSKHILSLTCQLACLLWHNSPQLMNTLNVLLEIEIDHHAMEL